MDAKHSIAVIADGPTATGFRLAGVENVFAAGHGEAQDKLVELIGRSDIGIIMVNEAMLDSVDWKLKRRIDRMAKPVVIAIPGKEGAIDRQEGSLKEMIKKALGFELLQ